jgi:HAE1 family hydrophobic/amphiphilic exporter-1
MMAGVGLLVWMNLAQPERSLITVQSFIAIIGLTGVVVNDSIVLIDFINKLRAEGVELRPAIVQACHWRMRPILMTTVTTIAGLTPMAIGIPEFSIAWSPMATCFAAGMAMATTLTLLVLPVLYEITERMSGWFVARFARAEPGQE